MTSGPERRWSAFAVCLCAAALAVLDISKVYVAIPALIHSFDADPVSIQLISAGYVLAFGLALIPAGRYGDLRSRRRVLVFGMLLFGIASLACGLAPSVGAMVAARLLQGAAAGIVMPQTLGLVQELFSGAERGRAFGSMGAVVGLTLALAPPLGGVLIWLGGASWGPRLVFLVNVPLVLILVPLAVKLLPSREPLRSDRRDLDLIGVALLAVTTLALMTPFVLTTGTAADNPLRWLVLPLGTVSAAGFVLWERSYADRGRAPLIVMSLFRHRGYSSGILIALVYYAGSPGALLVTTLFLQLGLGVSAVLSGLLLVPFAIAYACSAWWAGSRTRFYGRRLVIGGLAGAFFAWILNFGIVMVAPFESIVWMVPSAMVFAGASAGAVAAPNLTLTLSEIPTKSGGLAASISQVAQRLGAAVGVAVLVSVFYGTLGTEAATGGAVIAFRDAYGFCILTIVAFYVTALAIALVDGRRRLRQ